MREVSTLVKEAVDSEVGDMEEENTVDVVLEVVNVVLAVVDSTVRELVAQEGDCMDEESVVASINSQEFVSISRKKWLVNFFVFS